MYTHTHTEGNNYLFYKVMQSTIPLILLVESLQTDNQSMLMLKYQDIFNLTEEQYTA